MGARPHCGTVFSGQRRFCSPERLWAYRQAKGLPNEVRTHYMGDESSALLERSRVLRLPHEPSARFARLLKMKVVPPVGLEEWEFSTRWGIAREEAKVLKASVGEQARRSDPSGA